MRPGTKLGNLEITGDLGAGGMGEVYRARDTKLGREVAVKLLPESVSSDPGRLARLEREARVLASLNHPNIATLYGLEETADTRFLVMELVEGETLAERISCGPVPIPEALPIFHQIAEALEEAHHKGIIHRDLKPGNVKSGPRTEVASHLPRTATWAAPRVSSQGLPTRRVKKSTSSRGVPPCIRRSGFPAAKH
jgi:serine/threonine protein kinase